MAKDDPVRAAFLCGYTPSRMKGIEELLPGEQKLIRNFSQFLRGKGERCPDCLHKAKKHDRRCGAKGCSCNLTHRAVRELREMVGAP